MGARFRLLKGDDDDAAAAAVTGLQDGDDDSVDVDVDVNVDVSVPCAAVYRGGVVGTGGWGGGAPPQICWIRVGDRYGSTEVELVIRCHHVSTHGAMVSTRSCGKSEHLYI